MHAPAEPALFVKRLELVELWVAPPEYVVLRKMEFFREGGSAKHPADIRAIREITGIDELALAPWIERLGLQDVWQQLA
jgi:hypothetical protein